MSRTWGCWTRGKLDVLRAYLDAFTTTTKHKTTERIYLDLFAGETENRDRITNEEITGSAQIALSIDDPPFARLRFFEIDGKAEPLESTLVETHPKRDIKVYSGDCNERIKDALNELSELSWAPTFAFVDPDGMETRWSTLVALSNFRRNEKTKVELFILFAAPMFIRVLPVDGSSVRVSDATRLDGLFGSMEWRQIYRARLDGRIEPGEAREQYLNLMRWRLETKLGYLWTHPLEIRNVNGNPIYFMIFATDHAAGTSIMSDIYAKAAAEFPAMREEARRVRLKSRHDELGIMRLFEDDSALLAPIRPGERFYEHEPPTRPWFLADEL